MLGHARASTLAIAVRRDCARIFAFNFGACGELAAVSVSVSRQEKTPRNGRERSIRDRRNQTRQPMDSDGQFPSH